MKRQIYQNIGLNIALAAASVSLPLGIIGFMREPTIIDNYYSDTYNNNTYYEENYYYNNQTEPEAYYYPLESFTYINFTNFGNYKMNKPCIERSFYFL